MAPPFDFLGRSFLPQLCRMGAGVEATLTRPGFYPAGGGRFEVRITPPNDGRLAPLTLLDRGELHARSARALVSRLPQHIGQRELARVADSLGWGPDERRLTLVPQPRGPGNALICALEHAEVTAVFSGFGEKGVPAERVADQTIAQVKRYLQADVPVCEHLADQLLIPLALAGGGAFRTLALSEHTTTNIDVVQRFLDTRFAVTERSKDDVEVEAK